MAQYNFLVLDGKDGSLTYDTFKTGSDHLASEHVRAKLTLALKIELWCIDHTVKAI